MNYTWSQIALDVFNLFQVCRKDLKSKGNPFTLRCLSICSKRDFSSNLRLGHSLATKTAPVRDLRSYSFLDFVKAVAYALSQRLRKSFPR